MNRNNFPHQLLKSVSRSFYLSLQILPQAIRPAMGLGYLLCRAADSIADTALLPFDERLKILKYFESILTSFPIAATKLQQFAQDLKEKNLDSQSSEGRLLMRWEECLKALEHLSRTDQVLIQNVVRAVIQGMTLDLTTFGESAETLKAFTSQKDLESYIGWIGGEPGHFWTNVCLEHFPDLNIKDRKKFLQDGFRFGTGLQMINILRDLPSDLKSGRCYIPLDLLKSYDLTPTNLLDEKNNSAFLPLYHVLIEDTLARLKCGLDYIDQLPHFSFRLRTAVWWPLSIGLLTLKRLKSTYLVLDSQKIQKINRRQVYGILFNSLLLLPSNSMLQRRGKKLVNQIFDL